MAVSGITLRDLARINDISCVGNTTDAGGK
jgi:hypothetical protein